MWIYLECSTGSISLVAKRVQSGVDKLRSLGNAVIPKQAKEAFKMLMGLYEKSI